MSISTEPMPTSFVDRRNNEPRILSPGRERRQFSDTYEDLSPAARELALAVDHYKLVHRRRFITCEELLEVVQSLGYRK